MNMHMQKMRRMLIALTASVSLSMMSVNAVWAWYPYYGYSERPYWSAPTYWYGYPDYWQALPNAGWQGYAHPRWYMRGRMNRYGDFWFDIKIRNASMLDMYSMWLLFNGY